MRFIDAVLNMLRRNSPLERHLTEGKRAAGVFVTTDTALAHAAVWACVRVISETIATLSWQVIREMQDGSKREESGGNAKWLLNTQANPEMTAFTWRELALIHALMNGNHYSEIERDPMGRAIWLWPLRPERTRVTRDSEGDLTYTTYWDNGEKTIYPARNILHIHGLGWDGLSGYSVVSVAAKSLGLALAMDEMGSSFYGNGAQVGLVLEHPRTLSEPAHQRLKKSLDERAGAKNAFKTLIAEEGMTIKRPSMSMVDAQFLESRKLQVTEICRWFRVPPHKVADLERSTNNNIEHQSIEFVQDTILPWCRRLEQEVDLKLFGRAAQGVLRTRLNIDTLLRGDISSRYTAYKMGRDGGWLSPNDVRERENMNPIADGDEYMRPANMVPLGTEATPVVTPSPVSEPKEPMKEPEDRVTQLAAPKPKVRARSKKAIGDAK